MSGVWFCVGLSVGDSEWVWVGDSLVEYLVRVGGARFSLVALRVLLATVIGGAAGAFGAGLE